jgi:hypothetical protein
LPWLIGKQNLYYLICDNQGAKVSGSSLKAVVCVFADEIARVNEAQIADANQNIIPQSLLPYSHETNFIIVKFIKV